MGRRFDFLRRGWFAASACALLGISGCDEVGGGKPDNEPPANDNFGNLVPFNNIPSPSNPAEQAPGSNNPAHQRSANDVSLLNNPAISFAYKKGYQDGTDIWARSRYSYLRSMEEHQMESHLDELAEVNRNMKGVTLYPVPEMPPKWSPERLDWLRGFKDGLNAPPLR